MSGELRFHCTGCGRCCVGGGERQVWLNGREKQRLAQALQLTESALELVYLDTVAGQWVIRLQSNGQCSFLDDVGQCRVYQARPVQCETYPFWPEILHSETAWQEEAARCEGIDNNAAVVDAVTVESALRRQRARDAGL